MQKKIVVIFIMMLLIVSTIIPTVVSFTERKILGQCDPSSVKLDFESALQDTGDEIVTNTTYIDEINIEVEDDAYIDSENPDQNYGSLMKLEATRGISDFSGGTANWVFKMSLLRFSSSDLANIPVGATIIRAVLKLYLKEGQRDTNVYMHVAEVTTDWDETTVTYNKIGKKYIFPRNPPIATHIGLDSQWYEWDISRIVQGWVASSGINNYGILLQIYLEAGTPISGPLFERSFYSKESVNPENAPELIVEYSIGSPPTPNVDLSITNLEITQGIQVIKDISTPSSGDNDVLLIADKSTVVRLYVDIGSMATDSVSGVTAFLYRKVGSIEEHTYPINPITAVKNPDRENHHNTINFLLPQEWLHGSMELYAIINPSTLSRRVKELDYENNRFPSKSGEYVSISFESPGRELSIAWLKVDYQWSGWSGPNLAGDRVEWQQSVNFIRAVYPIASQNVNYYPWPGGTYTMHDSIYDDTDVLLGNLKNLYDLSTLRSKPDHLYGWVPDASTSYKGVGYYRGYTAYSEDCSDPNLLYRIIFTHEIGHNLHQYGHDDLDPTPSMPNKSPTLQDGEYGYDVEKVDTLGRVVMRYYSDGGTKYDLIDFMRGSRPPPAIMDGKEAWVTPYTYKGIDKEMTSKGILKTPSIFKDYKERCILISGFIDEEGYGTFNPFYILSDYSIDQTTGGNYSIEFTDYSGNVSYIFNFDIYTSTYIENVKPQGPFSFILPYPDETKTISLKYNNRLDDIVQVSANEPEVTLIYPNGNEQLSGDCLVKWEGNDVDNDSLSYAVLYSFDDGETWVALNPGTTSMEYEINVDELPGGDKCYIKILATDGVLTATDISDGSFIVEKKNPKVFIIKPDSTAGFTVGDPILFIGQGYDLEDGVINDTDLVWKSNIDGCFGYGKLVEINNLSVGFHKINLVAGDSNKSIAMDEITILVSQISNQLPFTPIIKGPKIGNIGTKYNYISNTTDSDGDPLYYLFNWGDGTNSNWIGPYEPGQECNAFHTWTTRGNYKIKVKVKDKYHGESEWSDSLRVIIIQSKTLTKYLLLKLYDHFTTTFPLLQKLLNRFEQ